MGLLILLYPFAEIYAYFRFIEAYSFWDAFIFVLLSGITGVLVLRLLGSSTLMMAQSELSQGRLPADRLLHRSLVILGGVFLIIPGIISDITGVLLILPGTRHLFAWYIARLVKRGLFKGRVFVGGLGGFGNPGGFHRPGGFGQQPGGFQRPDWTDAPVERDAQVVDIEPLEISHKNLPPDDDGQGGKPQ